jgi:hypothetical protein
VVRRHVRYIDGRRAIISDDYVDLRLVEGTEFAALENTTREGVLNRRTPPPRHSRGPTGSPYDLRWWRFFQVIRQCFGTLPATVLMAFRAG